MGPPVRAVIFDFGGVVFDSPVPLLNRCAERCGCDPLVLQRLFSASPTFHRLERGHISAEEFCGPFQEELDAANLPLDARTLLVALAAIRPRPHVLAALADLRRRGLRVVALTNNFKRRAADERGTGVAAMDPHFDAIFESCVLGLRKPDAAIFEHVLAALAVPAAQCVFIDDLRPNLRAAARLGLRTLHARDDRTFLADLFALLGDPVPTPPNTPARL
eukprot:EG_transcript_25502